MQILTGVPLLVPIWNIFYMTNIQGDANIHVRCLTSSYLMSVVLLSYSTKLVTVLDKSKVL
jgi:hypothetical protein